MHFLYSHRQKREVELMEKYMLIRGIRTSENPACTSLEYAVFIVFIIIFSCMGVLKYFGILENLLLFLGLGVGLAIGQVTALTTAQSRKTIYRSDVGYAFRMVNSDGIVTGVSGKKTHRRHLVDDILQNFIITLGTMGVMFFVAFVIRFVLRQFGY